jgi:citrate lyase subunit beta/citryl-CoA lyase
MAPSADERERERAIVKASEAARERGEDRALVDGLWVEVPTCRSAKRLIECAERPRLVSPP